MARGDGKNKFYRQLKLPNDIKSLIRFYNKIWKRRAYKKTKGSLDGFTGKMYTGRN